MITKRFVTNAGLALIKRFEQLKLEAYLCPAGVWTIGYGHTNALSGDNSVVDRVTKGRVISETQALTLLSYDVGLVDAQLENVIPKDIELNANQWNALLSFVFNIGIGNFKKSTVLKRLLAKDFEGAANALLMWDKVKGKTMRGLTLRRTAERLLFLSVDVDTQLFDPAINGLMPQEVDVPPRKSPLQSTTILSAIGAFCTTTLTGLVGMVNNSNALIFVCLLTLIAAGFAAWIIKERVKRLDVM